MVKPVLTRGTVEHLIVDVADELGEISTLETAGLKYDVMERDGTPVAAMQNLDGVAEEMQARCLIDTTALPDERYKLFIKFNALPEIPRLGPFDFDISDD